MPNVNLAESDFEALAAAANDAYESGDHQLADRLDKIARKLNAALSRQSVSPMFKVGESFGWTDAPTTIVAKMKRTSKEHQDG